MNIVVFVKQVADNTKLKLDTLTNVIPHTGVDMMINPYDEYALETALRLKESSGGESKVTVISLGDASVKSIVKKTIAAGADDAFLLSDEAFLGGDSLSTAKALAQAAKTLVPDHSVLLFGQMALDDAASQTGPAVAEHLNYPSLTACKVAELTGNQALKVQRETERGIETHEMALPGVICMMKCDYELRTSNIKGVMKANKANIPVKTPQDIGLDVSTVGVNGSKTTVSKLWQRPERTACTPIDGSDAHAAAEKLVAFLKEKSLV